MFILNNMIIIRRNIIIMYSSISYIILLYGTLLYLHLFYHFRKYIGESNRIRTLSVSQ